MCAIVLKCALKTINKKQNKKQNSVKTKKKNDPQIVLDRTNYLEDMERTEVFRKEGITSGFLCTREVIAIRNI